MNTRKSTTLSLTGKVPPIFTSKGSQGFLGSFPPTIENIILHYHGYHNYYQESTGRQSSIVDAVKLVVIDVQVWWEKSAIDIVSRQRLQGKILGIINHYKQRARYTGKTTEGELMKHRLLEEEIQNIMSYRFQI